MNDCQFSCLVGLMQNAISKWYPAQTFEVFSLYAIRTVSLKSVRFNIQNKSQYGEFLITDIFLPTDLVIFNSDFGLNQESIEVPIREDERNFIGQHVTEKYTLFLVPKFNFLPSHNPATS